MNILLTNDDGYNAPGISLLFNKLQEYGHVVIVAPFYQQSAKSTSKTLGKTILVHQIEKDIYAVEGTPADCTAFGLTSLSIKFDLVVSGCNNGWNISYDTIYSGTIGAGLEALVNKTPAICFSSEHGFDIVEQYFDQVMEFILSKNIISNEYLLNVNFPLDTVKDIRFGKLYYRNDTNFFIKENGEYYPSRTTENDFKDVDTDCYQVNHHIISIVPINKTFFDEKIYDYLVNK